MPNQKNITSLTHLEEKISSSKTVILANYMGLKVAQIQELKRAVKQENGEFTVVKNTLLNLALRNLKFNIPESVKFEFPTAILLSFKDEVAPLKKLVEFSKTSELPKLRFGFLGKDYLAEDRVMALSRVPTREVLLEKMLSSLNSSTYGMVWVLKGNLQKLVTVLSNYQEKINQ